LPVTRIFVQILTFQLYAQIQLLNDVANQ
jgi:hypothetical protein